MFLCEYERCCSQSESSMIARSCFLPPQTGSRGRWSCCSSHPASPPLPSLSLFLWTSLCPTLCLLILKERGLVRLVHWTTSPECQIKWNPNKWALEKSGSFFGVFSLYWQDHTTVLSYFFLLFIYTIHPNLFHAFKKKVISFLGTVGCVHSTVYCCRNCFTYFGFWCVMHQRCPRSKNKIISINSANIYNVPLCAWHFINDNSAQINRTSRPNHSSTTYWKMFSSEINLHM